MRFIHTSDWHLGQNIYSHSRQAEHAKFLDWLLSEINSREIDTLIVAGDVFDCGTPPGYAQKMYYDFLCRLAVSKCKQAFIIGGNHDSPAFLEASRQILGHLKIHVIAKATEELADMVFEIKSDDDDLEAIICAIPFLRDRDVRKSLAGESYDAKSQAVNEGISSFYGSVSSIAEQQRERASSSVPIIGTGHLFVSGCTLSESVREFIVGNLGAIHASDMAKSFDYLALGHLHVCQKVGHKSHLRYCGAPIPMSFDECAHPKFLIVGDTQSGLSIEDVEIPVFQNMKLLKGDLKSVFQQLDELKQTEASSCWVEVQCVEERDIPQLAQTLSERVDGSNIEIFAVRHLRSLTPSLSSEDFHQRSLSDLNPIEVFEKRLEAEPGYSDEDVADLKSAFSELMQILHDGERA